MDHDSGSSSGKPHDFFTRMSHAGRAGSRGPGFVNPAIHRGSTVLYPTMADRMAAQQDRMSQSLIYGALGGPTHWPLEDVLSEIEGGTRCQIVSTGMAAISTPLLAFLSAGDHALFPDSVYGAGRNFCDTMLPRLGISVEYYDPTISAADIEPMFRPETKVLYTESPGSHTFEMQDIPALAAVAHRHGAKVFTDNTWGIHYFQPFAHGVDVSIQALTKYVGGHSDVMLGAIITNDQDDWEKLRRTATALGQFASPDDCWLALRGVRTMPLRLKHQMESGLVVAKYLATRPEVRQVLYPALPGAPGHDIWKRDFTGACSLFAVELQPGFSSEAVAAAMESLKLFGMGASWGGFESLALPAGNLTRTTGSIPFAGTLVRMHIGLEDTSDLIEDLDQALGMLTANDPDRAIP